MKIYRQQFNLLDENYKEGLMSEFCALSLIFYCSEAFYIKPFRQILDHLYTTYDDYLKVLNEKSLCFHNLTPNRIQQLNVNDCKIMYKIVPGLSSEELLFTEFDLLRDSIEQCENMNSIVSLLQKSGHLYPRVAHVYNFLFTLPITTATNERCFSKQKFIKNKLRTTLKNVKKTRIFDYVLY